MENFILSPVYLQAFQQNREQLDLLFPSRSEKLPINPQETSDVVMNKNQRTDLLMKSHLSVILTKKLMGNMRYPRKQAQRVLTQQHDFKKAECVPTQVWSGYSIFYRYNAYHPKAPLRAMANRNSNTTKLWLVSEDSSFEIAIASLKGHTRSITSVVFHPNELLLATCSYDETSKLWQISSDYSSAKCVATLVGHTASVNSVAFHPTKPIMATGSSDMTVKLWKISCDPYMVTCLATLVGHTSSVYSVDFHPTSPLLATGGGDDYTAKLWLISSDISSANCISTLVHNDNVNYVKFNSNEPILTTVSCANMTNLWK